MMFSLCKTLLLWLLLTIHVSFFCGDFNVPHNIDWAPSVASQNASVFFSFVLDSFLFQMVDSATRGNNVLDLILTTHPDLVTD